MVWRGVNRVLWDGAGWGGVGRGGASEVGADVRVCIGCCGVGRGGVGLVEEGRVRLVSPDVCHTIAIAFAWQVGASQVVTIASGRQIALPISVSHVAFASALPFLVPDYLANE
jgi:hypothetical protein